MGLLAVEAGARAPFGTQSPEVGNTQQNQHENSNPLNDGVIFSDGCQRDLQRTRNIGAGNRWRS